MSKLEELGAALEVGDDTYPMERPKSGPGLSGAFNSEPVTDDVDVPIPKQTTTTAAPPPGATEKPATEAAGTSDESLTADNVTSEPVPDGKPVSKTRNPRKPDATPRPRTPSNVQTGSDHVDPLREISIVRPEILIDKLAKAKGLRWTIREMLELGLDQVAAGEWSDTDLDRRWTKLQIEREERGRATNFKLPVSRVENIDQIAARLRMSRSSLCGVLLSLALEEVVG